MKKLASRLVWDLAPTQGNARNSEGAFLRAPNGDILFAYSRYRSGDQSDGAPCDIAMIRSRDEGETWSEPTLIAESAFFGVQNIMSVSAITQKDGSLGFYFIIKENDCTSTLGRAVSPDGEHFTVSRCRMVCPPAYHVVNNDRIHRISDGRIIVPAARAVAWPGNAVCCCDQDLTTVLFASEDDGASFHLLPPRMCLYDCVNTFPCGLMEPGLHEMKNGVFRLWYRTAVGFQYESYSVDGLATFTPPARSIFSSPCSPMQLFAHGDDLYSMYNPIPAYNGREEDTIWERTPIVLRRSTDDGATWGRCLVLDDDPDHGYCYPAFFAAGDGSLLISYCRGGDEDGGCLCRLGIRKVRICDIAACERD